MLLQRSGCGAIVGGSFEELTHVTAVDWSTETPTGCIIMNYEPPPPRCPSFLGQQGGGGFVPFIVTDSCVECASTALFTCVLSGGRRAISTNQHTGLLILVRRLLESFQWSKLSQNVLRSKQPRNTLYARNVQRFALSLQGSQSKRLHLIAKLTDYFLRIGYKQTADDMRCETADFVACLSEEYVIVHVDGQCTKCELNFILSNVKVAMVVCSTEQI
jgi:hypothetical protein